MINKIARDQFSYISISSLPFPLPFYDVPTVHLTAKGSNHFAKRMCIHFPKYINQNIEIQYLDPKNGFISMNFKTRCVWVEIAVIKGTSTFN